MVSLPARIRDLGLSSARQLVGQRPPWAAGGTQSPVRGLCKACKLITSRPRFLGDRR
jgi:hypothetical protein